MRWTPMLAALVAALACASTTRAVLLGSTLCLGEQGPSDIATGPCSPPGNDAYPSCCEGLVCTSPPNCPAGSCALGCFKCMKGDTSPTAPPCSLKAGDGNTPCCDGLTCMAPPGCPWPPGLGIPPMGLCTPRCVLNSDLAPLPGICIPENTGPSEPCSPPGNDAYPQCCEGLECMSPPGCPAGSCALGCFKPSTPGPKPEECLPKNTGPSEPCSPPGNDAYPQCCEGLMCTSPPGCPEGSCALGCFAPAELCLKENTDPTTSQPCSPPGSSAYPQCCEGLVCSNPPGCPEGSCAPGCFKPKDGGLEGSGGGGGDQCLQENVGPSEPCSPPGVSGYPQCCEGLTCTNPPDCPAGSCALGCFIVDETEEGCLTDMTGEMDYRPCSPPEIDGSYPHCCDGLDCRTPDGCPAGSCMQGCFPPKFEEECLPDATDVPLDYPPCSPPGNDAYAQCCAGLECKTPPSCPEGSCMHGCFPAATEEVQCVPDATNEMEYLPCSPPDNDAYPHCCEGLECKKPPGCPEGSCMHGCFPVASEVCLPDATNEMDYAPCSPPDNDAYPHCCAGLECKTPPSCPEGSCMHGCFPAEEASECKAEGEQLCSPPGNDAYPQCCEGLICTNPPTCPPGSCAPGCFKPKPPMVGGGPGGSKCLPENMGPSEPCSPPGDHGYPQCCEGLTCTNPPHCPAGSCALGCFKMEETPKPSEPESEVECLPENTDPTESVPCSPPEVEDSYPHCCEGLVCRTPDGCPEGSCSHGCFKPKPTLCLPPSSKCVAGKDRCCDGRRCIRGKCRICKPRLSQCSTDNECCKGTFCQKANKGCIGQHCLRLCL